MKQIFRFRIFPLFVVLLLRPIAVGFADEMDSLIERIPRSLLRGYLLRKSLRNPGFLKSRVPLRYLVSLLRGVSLKEYIGNDVDQASMQHDGVTITTDKTIYMRTDILKFTIKNNLSKPIYLYAPQARVSLLQFDGRDWKTYPPARPPCWEIEDPSPNYPHDCLPLQVSTVILQPQDEGSYSAHLKDHFVDNLSDPIQDRRSKLEFVYYNEVSGIGKSPGGVKIFSNEFVIRSKSSKKIDSQVPESILSVTTAKTRYELGEKISVIVRNESNQDIWLIERIPRSLLRGYLLRKSLRNLGFLKSMVPLRYLVSLLRGVSLTSCGQIVPYALMEKQGPDW